MNLPTELTPLPHASRLLGVAYWTMYSLIVMKGQVPALYLSGRWWLTPENMAEAAQALGVTWPAENAEAA